MKRVGYVGLGIMGRPMAENLVKAGFEVVVWNRTRAKASPVIEAGARWADSPADVASQVQAVCVNVTDTPDVEQVIIGRHGIVEGNPGDTADLVVIDHSTISPQATREIASRLAEQGVDMLDAPVSGGDSGAKAGTLAIMVGGKPQVFERCRKIFEAVGQSIVHVGDHGAGQVCKACNQILCAVNLLAACEALALAKREGIDVSRMMQATSQGAGGSWQLQNLGPKIAAGDMAPGFMIDLINKDLNIVHEAAARLGLPLNGADLAANLFRAASAAGHGEKGTQALARVIEQLGGFRFDAECSDEEPTTGKSSG
jgi:3-hydroxyisobutyrate dehydrogenase